VDLVVVPLDVVEVDRVAEAGRLEQVARVGPEHGELRQLVPVALEVAVVDGVEAHQRREQAHVGLGDGVADEIALPGEAVREPVEPLEQTGVRLVVRLLAAGEAAPVDAVVDVPEHDLADRVDLVAQPLGQQVGSTLAVVRTPLGRQVQRDLREVVGDHLPRGDVDHCRHRDAALVVGEAGEEGLLQPLDAEHRVAAPGVQVEGPAALVVRRPAHTHRQHRLEAEQPSYDDRPVGPRARPGDHQPVPPRLDRVAVAAVLGDAGGDVLHVAGELAARVDVGPLLRAGCRVAVCRLRHAGVVPRGALPHPPDGASARERAWIAVRAIV
jgi:hypothetical protein